MSNHTNVLALIAASALAGSAGAGMLTMTASSATGVDDWAPYSGYTLELTIDCSTLDDANSSALFTLNAWRFKAFDGLGVLKFDAQGTNDGPFTVSPGSTSFTAVIGLSTGNIALNLVPAADSISFTYALSASGTESLGAAITASAGTPSGKLQLGTDAGGTGLLAGVYVVPAPGAAVLVGLGALVARRRRA